MGVQQETSNVCNDVEVEKENDLDRTKENVLLSNKTPVVNLPRMGEIKNDSIVIGGRTLRARTSTNPMTTGNRSRNSSGDSNNSQPSSRRTRSSSGVEVNDRRQSRTSVESETKEEPPSSTEGRVLRRRHNSNEKNNDQPPRKTRSTRSVSNEDQSSRESTPSGVS